MKDTELMALAREAAQFSYSPYSHFAVGAALECADGSIFTGCNVEVCSFSGGICAERTAMVKAISSGQRDFVRIAVWGDSKGYCYPCGTCRQFLQEFAPDITVLSGRADGEISRLALSQLLPYSFEL